MVLRVGSRSRRRASTRRGDGRCHRWRTGSRGTGHRGRRCWPRPRCRHDGCLGRRDGPRGRRGGLLPGRSARDRGSGRDRGRHGCCRRGRSRGGGGLHLDALRNRAHGRRPRPLHRLRHVLLVVADVAQVVAKLPHAALDRVAVRRPRIEERGRKKQEEDDEENMREREKTSDHNLNVRQNG